MFNEFVLKVGDEYLHLRAYKSVFSIYMIEGKNKVVCFFGKKSGEYWDKASPRGRLIRLSGFGDKAMTLLANASELEEDIMKSNIRGYQIGYTSLSILDKEIKRQDYAIKREESIQINQRDIKASAPITEVYQRIK